METKKYTLDSSIQEVKHKGRLPIIFNEDKPRISFCKLKLIPLKSVTLSRIEEMQKEALEKMEEYERKIKEEQNESNKSSEIVVEPTTKDTLPIDEQPPSSSKQGTTDVWSASD
uniref:BBSome-interacting protein 1 n=1 Tax=Rhabditophanes sp. KR3021 TaxID=114890 RepID=A0AC35TFS0_9BILA